MQVTLSTTTQVADELQVDPSTVRDWATAGRIPFELKTPGGHYRFDVEAVKDALRQNPPDAPEGAGSPETPQGDPAVSAA